MIVLILLWKVEEDSVNIVMVYTVEVGTCGLLSIVLLWSLIGFIEMLFLEYIYNKLGFIEIIIKYFPIL